MDFSRPIKLRDTKHLLSVSIMATHLVIIYLTVYLIHRCKFTWKVGQLALIIDYWNQAKFKQKFPLQISLPVTMEFWSTFVSNDSYTEYHFWYIGVII